MAFKSMTYERLARTRQVVALVLAAAVLTGVQPEALADESAVKDTHTVLVTGANRGLGLEFARQYKEAGSRVIGTARNPDEAEELAALDVRVMQLDVTNQESVDNLVAALDGEAIDVLINNAGIFPRGLSSNLGSIAENKRGSFYGYRESKAALNMFTKTLAAELGPEGFTCVVLTPGWVQTDMGGPNATLTPAESISGMKAVLDRLTPADNGTFWSYDGSQMPW